MNYRESWKPIFRAYAQMAVAGFGDTPREAAKQFFLENQSKRKCDVQEGFFDTSGFFVVPLSMVAGAKLQSFKGVGKSKIYELPDTKTGGNEQ